MVPGSSEVLNRATGRLEPCSAATCRDWVVRPAPLLAFLSNPAAAGAYMPAASAGNATTAGPPPSQAASAPPPAPLLAGGGLRRLHQQLQPAPVPAISNGSTTNTGAGVGGDGGSSVTASSGSTSSSASNGSGSTSGTPGEGSVLLLFNRCVHPLTMLNRLGPVAMFLMNGGVDGSGRVWRVGKGHGAAYARWLASQQLRRGALHLLFGQRRTCHARSTCALDSSHAPSMQSALYRLFLRRGRQRLGSP